MDKKKIELQMDYKMRIDTGWDCIICDQVATVNADGFTWCKKHWEEFDLGRSLTKDGRAALTIAKMRDEFINP